MCCGGGKFAPGIGTRVKSLPGLRACSEVTGEERMPNAAVGAGPGTENAEARAPD